MFQWISWRKGRIIGCKEVELLRKYLAFSVVLVGAPVQPKRLDKGCIFCFWFCLHFVSLISLLWEDVHHRNLQMLQVWAFCACFWEAVFKFASIPLTDHCFSDFWLLHMQICVCVCVQCVRTIIFVYFWKVHKQ